MNLKAAARQLGMTYQTAYRFVRTGELVAVKLGASYDISDAALEQFRRQRADLISGLDRVETPPAPHDQPTVDDPLSTLRTDLDTMLRRTTLTAQPVFDRLAQHAAAAIGDGCILRLLNDDGVTLRTAAVAHVDPTAHTLLAAMQSSPLPLALGEVERTALRDGTMQRADFLRQDLARRMIPREFVQYGDQLRLFGLLAVPVCTANGAVVGLLTIVRSTPGRAFDPCARQTAHELAQWAGAAQQRLAETRSGWKARSAIHRAAEAVLAIDPTHLPAQLADMLTVLADAPVAAAALTTDGTLLATNAAFGPEFATVLGDIGAWDRMLSGDADFLDTEIEVAGVRIDAHWAVAKRPDATPEVVIVTCTRTAARPAAAAVEAPLDTASFALAS